MLVGAKVCELTDGFLSFVCGLYVGILTSPRIYMTVGQYDLFRSSWQVISTSSAKSAIPWYPAGYRLIPVNRTLDSDPIMDELTQH